MKKKIVVFAGNGCIKEKEEYYYSLSYKTGRLLAEAGFVVVTGGGPGLMNEVCRGTIENGGKTIGVCLDVPGRIQSQYLTSRLMFNHLNQRQEKLLELGDGYLALPGGIGTLYEIMAILALKRHNFISRGKPFILVDNYYQGFNDLLEKMKKEGFADDNIDSLFTMVKTMVKKPEEAINILSYFFARSKK